MKTELPGGPIGQRFEICVLIFFTFIFTPLHHCFYEPSQKFRKFGVKSLSFGKISMGGKYKQICNCRQYFWTLRNSLFHKIYLSCNMGTIPKLLQPLIVDQFVGHNGQKIGNFWDRQDLKNHPGPCLLQRHFYHDIPYHPVFPTLKEIQTKWDIQGFLFFQLFSY